ncbi:MAG TPA: EF-hand domain-containing protein [Pirellulales bacterium]|nr:EF-hand domain-containing protein [Pirellulales bacterium]
MQKPPGAAAARKVALLALLAVAASVSPSRASDAESQALFGRLDANQDGQLTTDEVPAEKERLLKRLLRKADADRDGKLSRQEFIAGLSEPPADRLAQASTQENRPLPGMNRDGFFRRLDANGDGRVTSDELPAERRERLSMLLKRADADGDGAMTLKEFEALPRPADGGKTSIDEAATEPRPDLAPAATVVFAALDINKDGSLSAEEIAKAPQSLAALDKDGSGTITTVELQEARPLLATSQPAGPDPARIWQRLLMADKDGDGRLSADESPERLQRNFERLDTNKDGFIDESEFKSSIARLREALGKKES